MQRRQLERKQALAGWSPQSLQLERPTQGIAADTAVVAVWSERGVVSVELSSCRDRRMQV